METGPWQAVAIGVPLGIALPLLIMSGMFWLGTGEWQLWRILRDERRATRPRTTNSPPSTGRSQDARRDR